MPKVGISGVEQHLDGAYRVIARLRIAGTVREKHPVGLQRQHVFRGRLRRHHGHAAAVRGELAQDVALDAEIVGDDVEPSGRLRARGPCPGSTRPRSTRRAARSSRPSRDPCRPCPGNARAASSASASSTLPAIRQPSCAPLSRRMRVSLRVSMSGDAGDVLPLRGSPTASTACASSRRASGRVADHETRGVDPGGFHVLGVGARVADVGISQRDDLPAVRTDR